MRQQSALHVTSRDQTLPRLVYVSGPAHFATAGTGPSAPPIQVYDRNTGQPLSTVAVAGESWPCRMP